MDEDLAIIDTNTRNEKIKNFLLNNKRKIIIFLSLIIIILLCYFGLNELKKKQKLEISNLYNSIIIDYSKNQKKDVLKNLISVINKKDATYSPLSLYFIIDNDLLNENDKINELFNILIDETSLEKEIKNLIIYKKALFNADYISENELLKILKPIINSESVWKAHSLYLVAEYFYSKNEMKKSKEFFDQILIVENPPQDILKETQKRLNRDFGE